MADRADVSVQTLGSVESGRKWADLATVAAVAAALGVTVEELVRDQRGAPTSPGVPPVLDPGEAAAMLRLPPDELRALTARGAVPAHRLGDGYRYITDELIGWLRRQPGGGAEN